MPRPQVLVDAGYGLSLDTSKLRDLSIPVEQKPIKDLIWCFDLPLWEKDGTDDWNLTPQEVIEKKSLTSEHQERVEKSDLSYPILITFNKGKWVVVDGVHRLVKAYLLGEETIGTKVLQQDSEFFNNALI